jgi:hypothetical protein
LLRNGESIGVGTTIPIGTGVWNATISTVLGVDVKNGENMLSVRAVDNSGNVTISDSSSIVFTLPWLDLSLPNGGKIWRPRETENVVWQSDSTSPTVPMQINLVDNANAIYPLYTTIENSGAASEIVPDLASGDYLLQIKAVNPFNRDTVIDQTSSAIRIVNLSAPPSVYGLAKNYHVNITWNVVSEATQYKVMRKLDTESAYKQVGNVDGLVFVDDLTEGTQFSDYLVISTNSYGDSRPSDVVRVYPVFRIR